jgi:hypothetical protein
MKKMRLYSTNSLVAAVIFLILGSLLVFSTTTQDEPQAQPKDIIISPSSLGAVSFPHKLHFEDLEIECATCHHETNAVRLEMPHENYYINFRIDCQLCHRKDGTAATQAQSCSNCHLEVPNSVADETLSSKVVIHKHCWECHEISVGEEAGRSCTTCHIKDPGLPESPGVLSVPSSEDTEL